MNLSPYSSLFYGGTCACRWGYINLLTLISVCCCSSFPLFAYTTFARHKNKKKIKNSFTINFRSCEWVAERWKLIASPAAAVKYQSAWILTMDNMMLNDFAQFCSSVLIQSVHDKYTACIVSWSCWGDHTSSICSCWTEQGILDQKETSSCMEWPTASGPEQSLYTTVAKKPRPFLIYTPG